MAPNSAPNSPAPPDSRPQSPIQQTVTPPPPVGPPARSPVLLAQQNYHPVVQSPLRERQDMYSETPSSFASHNQRSLADTQEEDFDYEDSFMGGSYDSQGFPIGGGGYNSSAPPQHHPFGFGNRPDLGGVGLSPSSPIRQNPTHPTMDDPYALVPPRTFHPAPPTHTTSPLHNSHQPVQTPSPQPRLLEPEVVVPTNGASSFDRDGLYSDLTPAVEVTSASLPRPVRVESEHVDADEERPERRLEREWWERKKKDQESQSPSFDSSHPPQQSLNAVAQEATVEQEEDPETLRKHLHRVSVAYQEILAAKSKRKSTADKTQQGQEQGTPTVKEIEFMKLLNSERTFRASRLVDVKSGDGGDGVGGVSGVTEPRWIGEDGEGDVDGRRVSTVPK
ncbi:hypothetical protein HK097_006352, partial [Rhizophlyctis rosea]